MARILDRSGLEDTGTSGGGAPLAAGSGLGCPLTPFVAVESCNLFMPNVSADRAGIAGGLSGGSFLAVPIDSFRTGVCGGRCDGRDGRLGGDATSMVVTFGVDFVGFNPILDLSMSW